jgi:DNA topoisomerase IB
MTNIERLQNIGIRRLGSPKRGFRYKPVSGRLTKADLDRIEELKIPPAWTDVAINPAATGRVQAIGKDAAGRWQYLYHAVTRAHRNCGNSNESQSLRRRSRDAQNSSASLTTAGIDS